MRLLTLALGFVGGCSLLGLGEDITDGPCPSMDVPALPTEPLVLPPGAMMVDSASAFCNGEGVWEFSVFDAQHLEVLRPATRVEVQVWSLRDGDLQQSHDLAHQSEGYWSGAIDLECASAVAFVALPSDAEGPGMPVTVSSSFSSQWSGYSFGIQNDGFEIAAYAKNNTVHVAGAWILYPSLGQGFGPFEGVDSGDDGFVANVSADTRLTSDGMAFAFFGCHDGELLTSSW